MANNKDFKVKNGIQPTAYHEGLGTVVSGTEGYAISNASYDSVSFSVAARETSPGGIFFKTDGTKMFISGNAGDDVNEYSLSTAWDITTASYTTAFSLAGQSTNPTGIFFKSDGTAFFFVSEDGDAVYQYSLSTAWDISTLSYDSKSFSISSQETSSGGLHFKTDGTKMYVIGSSSDKIHQYSLSTAWDVSTASYDSVELDVSTYSTQPEDLFFSSDGTKVFVGGFDGGLDEYTLSTAWDLSTASYSTSFNTVSQTTEIKGVAFKDDGTKMYLIGTNGDTIYQYSTVQTTNTLDLSTGSVFEVTPTSDIQVTLSNPADSGTVSQATLLLSGSSFLDFANASYDSVTFSLSSQDSAPLEVFVKPDGTKMYIAGNGNDSIFQYSLSTAYDLSTASYDSVSFSVASQDIVPFGLFFKPDGTKMYVCGWGNDSVYEYDLSTAWDISSASYNSVVLSVATQDPRPSAIFFKPDGTKMYMVGDEYNAVYQYSLSTAWDLSTASYDSVSFSVGSQDGEPKGLSFTSSGEDMFIAGDITGDIYHYSLSTAFDISTASYVDSLSHSSQASSPVGISIKQGNDKMYVVDVNGVAVYQYTIGSGIAITYDSTLEWPSGTAPTSPALGETDVITFTTSDGGTSYQAVQAIDGAS